MKSLTVVVMMVGALFLGSPGDATAAADTFILRTGDHLTGDLGEAELTLTTPQGTYRVTRATVRSVQLCYCGDRAYLRNGSQIVGLLDQGRYTLRLPGGQTRVLNRGEVDTFTLDATAPPAPRTADALLLANGSLVYGDVTEPDIDLLVPTGSLRFTREHVARVVLNTVVGDSVDLRSGDELSGIVDRPRYAIQTPDGQVLTFGREEVRAVALGAPPRPAAAAPPTVAAPVAPPAPLPPAPAAPAAPAPAPAPVPPPVAPAPAVPPPAVAAVPPAALPPPVRTALRDVYFEFDRWDLTPEARKTLDELATALRGFPSLTLRLEGHADERGTTEYNLALGARRAQAAGDYLVSLGIDPARLETVSFGEERPFDPGRSEQAWTLNRRVHFVVKSQ